MISDGHCVFSTSESGTGAAAKAAAMMCEGLVLRLLDRDSRLG
jgi:hypothetical protein